MSEGDRYQELLRAADQAAGRSMDALGDADCVDLLVADMTTFHIHSHEDETKEAPYDWKPKKREKPQGTMLEKMHSNDTVQNIWDMLTLRDVFALSFVSQSIREQTVEHAKKIKYVTKRSRIILTDIFDKTLRSHARDWLDIMRDHAMYVGGSSILQGILFDRSWTFQHDPHGKRKNPWHGHDLDVYIKTDAGFGMLKPKLDKMFEAVTERDPKYGSWFYGKWIARHMNDKYCTGKCEIDVISADNGIECYDLTVCQSSISWDGKMRCLNMYDIVHMEMKLSRLFENQLTKMIGYAVAMNDQVRGRHIPKQTSSGMWISERLIIDPMVGGMDCCVRHLLHRIKKYKDRGFTFDDANLKALFDNEVLHEHFKTMSEPSGWQAL
jgi:hypothetical protein